MKEFFLFISFLLMSNVGLKAQDNRNDTLVDSARIDRSSHQVGLSLSYTQGIGFTYKRWFKNRFGVQGSILPFVMDEVHFILGGSLLCRFALDRPSFPYINAGSIYHHHRYGGSYITNSFGFGIGAGYEFNIKDVVAINLKIDGLVAIFESDGYPSWIPVPFPLPGFGITYRF